MVVRFFRIAKKKDLGCEMSIMRPLNVNNKLIFLNNIVNYYMELFLINKVSIYTK